MSNCTRFESRILPNTFQQSVFGSEFNLFLSAPVCFHFISLSIHPHFFVFLLSVEFSAPSVSFLFVFLTSSFLSLYRSLFLTFPSSFMYFFTSVFLLPFYCVLFALQPSFRWIPCAYRIVACTAVALQRRRDKANQQRPLLGNGSINTFPLQRIVTQ